MRGATQGKRSHCAYRHSRREYLRDLRIAPNWLDPLRNHAAKNYKPERFHMNRARHKNIGMEFKTINVVMVFPLPPSPSPIYEDHCNRSNTSSISKKRRPLDTLVLQNLEVRQRMQLANLHKFHLKGWRTIRYQRLNIHYFNSLWSATAKINLQRKNAALVTRIAVNNMTLNRKHTTLLTRILN